MIDFLSLTSPSQKMWDDYWITQKHFFDMLPWPMYDILRFACENSFFAGYNLGTGEK